MNVERMLDEMGPDYPEARIDLIDALRNYISATRDLALEVCSDRAHYDDVIAGLKDEKEMLRKLEAEESDPTLCGIIKDKRR